jgi:hypothetical protein
MEKYMTDDRSQRARAAAEAGTATREQAISTAFYAMKGDAELIHDVLPDHPSEMTADHLKALRPVIEALQFNEQELARLIAQRDGYADPRQGYLRELTEGDEPGVALNGWGSKR